MINRLDKLRSFMAKSQMLRGTGFFFILVTRYGLSSRFGQLFVENI